MAERSSGGHGHQGSCKEACPQEVARGASASHCRKLPGFNIQQENAIHLSKHVTLCTLDYPTEVFNRKDRGINKRFLSRQETRARSCLYDSFPNPCVR